MTDKLKKLLEVIDPNSIILGRNYERLVQNVTQLEAVSGYSLDELKSLFLKGCTLSPPGPALTLGGLYRETRVFVGECENPEPWERHMVQRFMKEN